MLPRLPPILPQVADCEGTRLGDGEGTRRAASEEHADLVDGALLPSGALLAADAVAIPALTDDDLLDLPSPRDARANGAVLALVASFLPIAAAFALFDATQVAAGQALRGLKDVRVPMILTGVAYWGVGFPLSAWLGLGTELGAVGVWWGLLVSLGAAAALLGARLWLITRD